MKKLKKLMNYKTKQTKDIKTYNPFDTDYRNDGNYEMSHTKLNNKSKFQIKTKNYKTQLQPAVHNYNKTVTGSPTKTKAAGNTFFLPTTKKSQQQKELKKSSNSGCTNTTATATSSTSRTAHNGSVSVGVGGGNNINYSSLDRMRNSSYGSEQTKKGNRKRRWPHLWWQRYGRYRKENKSWRLKYKLSVWRPLRKKLSCCKCLSSSFSSSYQYNSDEDDDIDAKFNAYIYELRQREAQEAKEEKEKEKEEREKNKTLLDTALTAKTLKTADKNYKRPLSTISMTSQLDVLIKHETNLTIDPPTICHTPLPTSATTQVINSKSSNFNNSTLASLTTTTTPAILSCNHNTVTLADVPPRYIKSNTNATALLRRHSQHETSNNPRRVWTWDDSLRSNSDRFLETLEEDACINDFVIITSPSIINTASTSVNSSRCSVTRSRPSLQQLLAVQSFDEIEGDDNGTAGFVVIQREEAKAAAEDLSRSPVMGQRNANDPTSSPIQSRGSASSDNWPTQSDEDIDRWVAMHQNRGSFSSLGPRSDSMASVYSGAGEGRYGTVVVKGQVEFGMQYNYKLAALEIHVVRCKDLAAVDTKRNRSDPYVKVYLLPDKSKAGKRKTKVKKHTLNPIFDEILRFHMPISNLESRTLWLTVWHSDMFGRNDFLGEVNVNLQGRVFDNPQSQWYLLQERSEPFDEVASYRGDIVVGLKYVTPEGSKSKFMRAASLATGGGLRKFGSIKSVTGSKTDRSAKGGQLHVLVKEAKHLTPIKPNGSCDAFCKSYLLPDRTRSSKQKTPIVKRSTNPSWNYTFIYEDVSLEDLSERALELTVWDHDRLASNEFLGGVRFSLGTCKSYGRQVDWMDASGKELSLWQNMLDRPNFWVEGSVVLRSSLDGIRAIP